MRRERLRASQPKAYADGPEQHRDDADGTPLPVNRSAESHLDHVLPLPQAETTYSLGM
jgi:hypothetical protein